MVSTLRLIISGTLVCGVLLGCKKKEEKAGAAVEDSASGKAGEPAAHAGKDALPGASDVRAALERKEYSGVVERLAVLKPMAVTPDQINEYSQLLGETREKLLEESTKDPKAAEALASLRMMMTGR